MLVLNYVIVGVIGLILGYKFFPKWFGYGCIHGELKFYESDPGESPIMTAELFEYPENIRSHKYVIFRVSPK